MLKITYIIAYIPLYTKQIFCGKTSKLMGWLFSKRPLGLPCTVRLYTSIFKPRNESIGSMLPKGAHTTYHNLICDILKLNVVDVMVKEKQNLFTY